MRFEVYSFVATLLSPWCTTESGHNCCEDHNDQNEQEDKATQRPSNDGDQCDVIQASIYIESNNTEKK